MSSSTRTMTISQYVEQGRVPVTVFHIRGEINSNTWEQLQAEADQAHREGMQNLLLDLTDVRYVSSAGLRAMHHIFQSLRTNAPGESDEAMSKGLRDGTFQSPHLKLLNPNPSVHEVLKVSGFDMYIPIFHTLKEAIASY
jgi:anti-anti-sigma factor